MNVYTHVTKDLENKTSLLPTLVFKIQVYQNKKRGSPKSRKALFNAMLNNYLATG